MRGGSLVKQENTSHGVRVFHENTVTEEEGGWGGGVAWSVRG